MVDEATNEGLDPDTFREALTPDLLIALGRLSMDEREIFIDHVGRGVSLAQIARDQGISDKTVWGRWDRARRRVAKEMAWTTN